MMTFTTSPMFTMQSLLPIEGNKTSHSDSKSRPLTPGLEEGEEMVECRPGTPLYLSLEAKDGQGVMHGLEMVSQG